MARKGTGLAVAIGAAIAIGAVVAFASAGKKKTGAAADVDEDEDEGEAGTPSPVSPTTVQIPPLVPGFPPVQVSFPATTTQSPGQPPINPPVTPTTPGVPPVVELPDEDEDDSEAESPTVVLPGGVKVEVPAPGTTVSIPGTDVNIPVPAIPGVNTPPVVPVSTGSVEQPSAVPADTAQLVAMMLAEEATPNWKRKIPELGVWQTKRGLTPDQSFGPGSAKRMAQEIGTIPIVRFWPKGTLPQTALGPYKAALQAIAASAPEPRRAQLIMSANREQGQAFGTPPKPITTLLNLKAVAA
jgi:hypothetical protein